MAVRAQVPVTAFRGLPVAYSTIPLVASFIGPAVGLSDFFLFKDGTMVSGTIILEVTSFEVSETAKLG